MNLWNLHLLLQNVQKFLSKWKGGLIVEIISPQIASSVDTVLQVMALQAELWMQASLQRPRKHS